ncbi:hypothetical protein MP638_000635, partial [Amoeboaphelidium occidentale]
GIMDRLKGLYIASLVTYITGFFVFIPQLASIMLSYIILSDARLQSKKRLLAILTTLELIVWILIPTMSWLTTRVCRTTQRYVYGVDIQRYAYQNVEVCEDEWIGWIFIVLWFSVSLATGISRLTLTNEVITQETPAQTSARLQRGSIICYTIGMIYFVPHLASVFMGFDMVNRGYVVRRRVIVLILLWMELIAWLTVPCTIWITGPICYNCSDTWLGWIGLVAWFIVALSVGIPRLILTSQLDGPNLKQEVIGQALQRFPQVAQQVEMALRSSSTAASTAPYPSAPYPSAPPQSFKAREADGLPGYAEAIAPVPAAGSSSAPHRAARRMSLETLALELNIPNLLLLKNIGVDQVLEYKYNDLNQIIQITPEEYLRLKAFKTSTS